MSKNHCLNFLTIAEIFEKSKLFGVRLHPELYNTGCSLAASAKQRMRGMHSHRKSLFHQQGFYAISSLIAIRKIPLHRPPSTLLNV